MLIPRATLRLALRIGLVLSALGSFGAPRPARGEPRTLRVLPVHLHIAQKGGQPVVDESFLEARLERANAIYAPYRVRFETTARDALPERYAVQDTRADRDALAARTTRYAIDCFVVASLRDVDEPARMRRGVHWHAASHPHAHYVILSSIAGLNVLAHELGHYLGNPEHSQVVGNLMSYMHTAALPVLDAAQQTRLERALAGYVRRGELHLVPQARAAHDTSDM